MTTKRKHDMKKILSGLTALLLLLTVCAGCGNNGTDLDDGPISSKGIYYDLTGIEPSETMLEYDGGTIPAEMYFYWLGYSCSYVEYQINMYSAYGMYADLLNEDGGIVWDGALDDTTPSQYAKDSAESNALSYIVLENMAKEHSVALTDEDKADMESVLAQQMEQSGGEEAFQESLNEMGISRETFDRISSASYLLSHLQALAADPSSDLYEAPSQEENAYVDHILLATRDTATGESLSEEEIEAKRTQAEDLLSQLQGAEDTEDLFNQLVEEYGEDPGRAAEAGYLVNPQTNFVPEFLDATFALQPGEISGIVESEHGFHILLRKELTEDQTAYLAGEHLNDLLSERMETALDNVKRSEKLDGIDAGDFYTRYMAVMDEIAAANAPQDDTAADGTDAAPDSAAGTPEDDTAGDGAAE